MNLEITFRHLDHTDAIDEKIKDKVSKFQKRNLSEGANMHWTSWVEHEEHYSTFRATDKGREYFVKASADNLYKTIDLVIHKMQSQIEHHHR